MGHRFKNMQSAWDNIPPVVNDAVASSTHVDKAPSIALLPFKGFNNSKEEISEIITDITADKSVPRHSSTLNSLSSEPLVMS